jgi:hypothetical protein
MKGKSLITLAGLIKEYPPITDRLGSSDEQLASARQAYGESPEKVSSAFSFFRSTVSIDLEGL